MKDSIALYIKSFSRSEVLSMTLLGDDINSDDPQDSSWILTKLNFPRLFLGFLGGQIYRKIEKCIIRKLYVRVTPLSLSQNENFHIFEK